MKIRKIKKITAGLVALCICCMSLSTLSVSASNGSYEPENGAYIMHHNYTVEEIASLSQDELENMELLPVDVNSKIKAVNSSYLVTSTLSKQINSYYCGPATTLQILKIAKASDSLSGSTDAEKQATLAGSSYLHTDDDKGTWIEYIPPVLNAFISRNRAWTTMKIDADSDSSLSDMQYYIRSNHAYGYGVIYLVQTDALDYYEGYNCNHYISGSGIYYGNVNDVTDYDSIELRLNDPNNDSTYYGIHRVKFTQVARGMDNYSTNRGPANFVY